MPQVVLTDLDIEILKDILDAWLDGYSPATEQVQDDRSFDEPEEMLEAVGGMIDMHDSIVNIRTMLHATLTNRKENNE